MLVNRGTSDVSAMSSMPPVLVLRQAVAWAIGCWEAGIEEVDGILF